GVVYREDRAPRRAGPDDVTFTDPGKRPDRPVTASTRGGRHERLVGLFGELNAASAATGGPFDGVGNLSQITAAAEGSCFDPTTNRAGDLLAFASTQHRPTADIYIKSTTGHTITQITADPADDVMPAFDPDGKQIAFASNRDGDWNIYLTTTNANPAVQVTNDADHELHPTFSPDGQHLAYSRYNRQSGVWEIWIADLSTGLHHRIEYGLFPQWNPDPSRNKILFQRARARGTRLFSIWTIDYVNGEAMHPTEIVSAANAAAMHPAWSPDGTRIAFVTVVDPDRQRELPIQSDLWVINLDGTNKTNLTNGQARNLYPEWAADGSVYFLSNRSGNDNIWALATGRTIDLNGREPRLDPVVTVTPTASDGVQP
ncbi:MAG: hypothetical protein HKO59_12185, partial [Phycisphaerales bacterium]|nr:hypothetical protein [Phycisphaerales bacterium]